MRGGIWDGRRQKKEIRGESKTIQQDKGREEKGRHRKGKGGEG